MKFSIFLLAVSAGLASACPGQEIAMRELTAKLQSRQSGPDDSNELIGDLATLGGTTVVGKVVQNILQGTASPMSDASMGFLSSALCLLPGADACCIWYVLTLCLIPASVNVYVLTSTGKPFPRTWRTHFAALQAVVMV